MLMAEPPPKAQLTPTLKAYDQRLAIMAAGEQRKLWRCEGLVDGRYVINRARPGEPDDIATLSGPEVDRIPFTFFVEPVVEQGETA